MARRSVAEQLEDVAYSHLVTRARAALAIYNARHAKSDDPSYPFGRKQGERSVKDPRSQSITRVPGGIKITIDAPGAAFLEFGNAPDSGGRIQAREGSLLTIPLKKKDWRTKKGKKGSFTMIDGKPFFVTKEVNPYQGTNALRDAVRAVFGFEPKVIRGG